MPNMISPNELHDAAKKHMLEGKEPVTDHEWSLCVNFWAANILPDFAILTANLMAKIYKCPLKEETVEEIAFFQAERKRIK